MILIVILILIGYSSIEFDCGDSQSKRSTLTTRFRRIQRNVQKQTDVLTLSASKHIKNRKLNAQPVGTQLPTWHNDPVPFVINSRCLHERVWRWIQTAFHWAGESAFRPISDPVMFCLGCGPRIHNTATRNVRPPSSHLAAVPGASRYRRRFTRYSRRALLWY